MPILGWDVLASGSLSDAAVRGFSIYFNPGAGLWQLVSVGLGVYENVTPSCRMGVYTAASNDFDAAARVEDLEPKVVTAQDFTVFDSQVNPALTDGTWIFVAVKTDEVSGGVYGFTTGWPRGDGGYYWSNGTLTRDPDVAFGDPTDSNWNGPFEDSINIYIAYSAAAAGSPLLLLGNMSGDNMSGGLQ